MASEIGIGLIGYGTFSSTTPAASIPGAETPTATIQWHLASIAAFLQAFGDGTAARPNLADGLAVDRVLAAALQSSAHGGVTISVSPL